MSPPSPGKPAAKEGDQVVGVDTHIVMIPSPGGPVPTPMPMAFTGKLDGALSGDVFFEDKKAATKDSTASNSPKHVPAGGPFQKPPQDSAKVQMGSATVLVNDKQAARLGDPAMTCNDPADAPNGTLVATGKVLIGG